MVRGGIMRLVRAGQDIWWHCSKVPNYFFFRSKTLTLHWEVLSRFEVKYINPNRRSRENF